MGVGRWTKQTEMSMEHLCYYSLQLYTKLVNAESVQKRKEFKQQKAAYVVKIENRRRLYEQQPKKTSNKSVSQYPKASYQVLGIWLWSGSVGELCQKNWNKNPEQEYSIP